jgi:hypothetical protein
VTKDPEVKVVVSPSGKTNSADVAEKSEKIEIDAAAAVDIGLVLSMISLGIFNTRWRSKSDVFYII